MARRNDDDGPVVLPDNREQAFQQLFAAGGQVPTLARLERELPAFSLYLNYAVDNLKALVGLNNDEDKLATRLAHMTDDEVAKLADFLWAFRCECPERDLPKEFVDCREAVTGVVTSLFNLRHYFVHRGHAGIAPLLADRKLYVMFEGVLFPMARGEALRPGRKTEKLFKLKLMNVQEYDEDKEKRVYAFTRKGLIFLICMALYKDDAEEFCRLLDDMKSLAREEEGAAEAGDPAADARKRNRARGLCDAFTYFSYRRGRSSMDLDDLDFMCFADILGYLNKVPAVAYDCLSLDAEKAKLAAACAQSDESPENKEFKYALHKRFRNRFLSFAAAYCEDFGLFPSLRFKRLDVAPHLGRKRYAFGAAADNRNRLDRHYAINHGSLGFEWQAPDGGQHGPVRITALRSAIGAGEMKRLLFAVGEYLDGDKDRAKAIAAAAVSGYFAAYHRILETALNCDDPAALDRCQSPFLEDFATVAGCTADDVRSGRFAEVMAPYFPANFLRFFVKQDGGLNRAAMQSRLCRRLEVLAKHAEDFLKRMRRLEAWRAEDPEKRAPAPHCGRSDGLAFPPPSCRFSDEALINQVFQWLNLWLKPEERFRQLPCREQHHEDDQDHEYQLVHAAIGRFALDQKGLWKSLDKFRPADEYRPGDESRPPFRDHVNKLKQRVKEARGRTLYELAKAATQLCLEEYHSRKEWFDGCDANDAAIADACRFFGVRVGLPMNHAALVKTVLRIDEAKWRRAFDYARGRPFAGRSLADCGHVVSQVPFPHDFAQRLLRKKTLAWQNNPQNPNHRLVANCAFDFNRAFADDFAKDQAVLRDYYDASPLIAAFKALKRQGDWRSVPGVNPDSFALAVAPAPATADKAIRELKDVRNEDLLLLRLAQAYRQRFVAGAAGAGEEQGKKGKLRSAAQSFANVYGFFDTTIVKDYDGVAIALKPNDLFRPVYALICKTEETDAKKRGKYPYVKTLAHWLSPDGSQKGFAFYDLMMAFRRLQAADRRKRLELIPLIERFDARVELPPHEAYEGLTRQQIRDMERPLYQKEYRAMRPTDYDVVADARNAVYHDGLGLEVEAAKEVLRRLL